MDDLELLSFMTQQAVYCEAFIKDFTALLFAFLFVSYLVSHKLDRVMAGIVIMLYSAMALRYAFVFYNTSNDIVSMTAVLRKMAVLPDSNIPWLDIGPVEVLYPSVTAILLLSYLASLVFFFYTRRNPRQTEVSIG